MVGSTTWYRKSNIGRNPLGFGGDQGRKVAASAAIRCGTTVIYAWLQGICSILKATLAWHHDVCWGRRAESDGWRGD